MMPVKIAIESHIPYIKGLLEPFATVVYLAPEEFTTQALADVDAMIIRTRTRCNAALLDGTRVKWIGTATIGTDHIDFDYCLSHGITVVNAPGCNAPAVAQYVLSVIGHWMRERCPVAHLNELTLGVVGAGHVGSIIVRWARQIGFNVLVCDPPRARREGHEGFVSIDYIAQNADIITFHTPLYRHGIDATFHLANEQWLASLSRCKLLINSARGPIVDNAALALSHGFDFAIDCWEGEPSISTSLLQRAFCATPHIAGYSVEGKLRGTAMVVEALNQHFGWNASPLQATTPYEGAAHVTLPQIMESYNPLTDTTLLRTPSESLPSHFEALPSHFEALRNHYTLRHETGFIPSM